MPRIGTLSLPLILAAPALAQCTPHWTAYPGPQLDNGLRALTVWDPDGPGPMQPVIVAGGNFEHAGSAPLSFVGLWDGAAWRAMGDGVSGTVACATTYVVAGQNRPVIGGFFSQSGGSAVNQVAEFDGARWLSVGGGVSAAAVPSVEAIAPFGGGLAITGVFHMAGGSAANFIARWDGAAWHPFADESAGTAITLDSGLGSFYAGGYFTVPGTSNVATGILRWSNPTWDAVGQNFPAEEVEAITTYQGQVIAGGLFTNQCCGHPTAPGEFIARYDGTSWQPLGSGLDGPVLALCVFDPDGPGPMPALLIAGGSFSNMGSNIAAWDGSTWTPLGPGTTGAVRALTVWNNQLVVAGEFYAAGGLVSPGMAFWGCPQAPVCYANCDHSTSPPVLNVSDFVCFQQQFAAGDPQANCDGSTSPPVLNVADFVCFQQQFAAGCL